MAFNTIKRPLLSKKNKIARFEICSRWIKKADEEFCSIIFTDECKFNLFTPDRNTKVWRKPGQGLDSRYLDLTVKHGGGSVMVWGCISSRGVGNLVFIDVTMDKYLYTNILANNLSSSAAMMGLNHYTL